MRHPVNSSGRYTFDAMLHISLPVFPMFLEPNRRFTLKMYSDVRGTCFWCQPPTLVLRCVIVSSSYVGTSNRRTKHPNTRQKCNRTYSVQHFPQRAQSIPAEAVLADTVQTCQLSTEELLPTDNYHRQQTKHSYCEQQSRQL